MSLIWKFSRHCTVFQALFWRYFYQLWNSSSFYRFREHNLHLLGINFTRVCIKVWKVLNTALMQNCQPTLVMWQPRYKRVFQELEFLSKSSINTLTYAFYPTAFLNWSFYFNITVQTILSFQFNFINNKFQALSNNDWRFMLGWESVKYCVCVF